MEGGGRKDSSTPVTKFAVYQNPALSAALTKNSLRPSKSTFLFILTIASASAFSLVSFVLRENDIVDSSKLRYVTQDVAHIFLKVMQAVMTLVFIGSLFALLKAISLLKTKAPTPSSTSTSTSTSTSNTTNQPINLTSQQLKLLGIKPKFDQTESKPSTDPPKSKPKTSSPFSTLIPLHQTHITNDKSSGKKIHSNSFTTPSKPPASPSVYLIPPSQSPNMKTPPSADNYISTPWSSKRSSSTREISTEKQLETFLADFDEKFSISAGKMTTPPPTVSGFNISTPSTTTTTRSTPLRPVRMSPNSKNFNTPPKKGEADLPPPMSMEGQIDGFARLGIYPQIEEWRDLLRQWFSSVLLNPLLAKVETSHVKVMEAAAKLGVTITVSEIGIGSLTGATASVSNERSNEWQPAYTLDEEGLLGQLRNSLLQQMQNNTSMPVVQECVDVITEHQKLLALMKGEWAKGLLPQSSIRADYTVQRIRELAVGTCVKNYEYITNREKFNKKWSEVPTDSHLLLYLFCAFLEHPKWMLHVDPTSHAGPQSSRNPLFLGVLPSKDRFPEKYLGVICGVPSVIHPGACLLAFDKKCPPVFALYWDKKPQFSFEGRTALWDAVLVLCYKIKSDYGGIVRGMHLGSSALGILEILNDEKSE